MSKLSTERWERYDWIFRNTKNSPIRTIKLEGNFYHFKLDYALPYGECHYARIFPKLIYLKECLGVIKPGDTLLETTSGSGGRAAAAVAKALGYEIKIAMPAGGEKVREEAIKKTGAELILTPQDEYINSFPEFISNYLKDNPNTKYLNHSMGNLLGYGKGINHAAIDAFRPFVYEVIADGIKPDVVISPLGNGTTTYTFTKTFPTLLPGVEIIGFESVLSANSYRKLYVHEHGNDYSYENLFGIKPEENFLRNDLPGTTPTTTTFPMPALEAVTNTRDLHKIMLVSNDYENQVFKKAAGFIPQDKSNWVVRWDFSPLPGMKDFGRTGKAGFACALKFARNWRMKGKHFLVPVFDAAWHYDD